MHYTPTAVLYSKWYWYTLYTTGWFKLNGGNLFPGQSPWRFFESDRVIRPNIFGENKQTEVRPRDGHKEHVCKISGSIS